MHKGLKRRFNDTNIILHGGVDDVWLDTHKKKINCCRL